MRSDTFTFKINTDERRMIASLADSLNHSQSDSIRFVISQAVKALAADPQPTPAHTAKPQRVSGATK